MNGSHIYEALHLHIYKMNYQPT